MERFISRDDFYITTNVLGNDIEFEVACSPWQHINMTFVRIKLEGQCVLDLASQGDTYEVRGEPLLNPPEIADVIKKVIAHRGSAN